VSRGRENRRGCGQTKRTLGYYPLRQKKHGTPVLKHTFTAKTMRHQVEENALQRLKCKRTLGLRHNRTIPENDHTAGAEKTERLRKKGKSPSFREGERTSRNKGGEALGKKSGEKIVQKTCRLGTGPRPGEAIPERGVILKEADKNKR